MDLSNITVNKQNSIRIEGTAVLYFDPFDILEETQDADVIFLTHEHYDHFQPESIVKVMNKNTVLIAPESMKSAVEKVNIIPAERCRFVAPGMIKECGKITFETVPAYNKLKPFHPKMKKWVGYRVTMDEVTYYIAGDTDVNEDIKKVTCDVALVPIGGGFTMDKKQAADYILRMKPKAVIPTHYGEVVGKPADGTDFQKMIESADSQIQVELKIKK